MVAAFGPATARSGSSPSIACQRGASVVPVHATLPSGTPAGTGGEHGVCVCDVFAGISLESLLVPGCCFRCFASDLMLSSSKRVSDAYLYLVRSRATS